MLEMERVIRGQEYVSGKVYTFSCLICGTKFTYDEPGEPLCSGPNAGLDEHPPEMMRLVQVLNLDKVEKNASPETAEARAAGPLWVPPTKG